MAWTSLLGGLGKAVAGCTKAAAKGAVRGVRAGVARGRRAKGRRRDRIQEKMFGGGGQQGSYPKTSISEEFHQGMVFDNGAAREQSGTSFTHRPRGGTGGGGAEVVIAIIAKVYLVHQTLTEGMKKP